MQFHDVPIARPAQGMESGFPFEEVGLLAQDPDVSFIISAEAMTEIAAVAKLCTARISPHRKSGNASPVRIVERSNAAAMQAA